MAKSYYSYVRVSTQRQGQQGTSISEQTAAIERYARTWNLPIVKSFEERETAAKVGRKVFLEMMKALRRGAAAGVIIHKIDRSARNLRDWAELGTLIDAGIEVHFANESLDLTSRGGRLSADIQAVVASDYIRNLREETIKGIRGRIKQGFYPFPAPIGYLNKGKAKAKEIDPHLGPLMRMAFELYASGEYSLVGLSEKMAGLGLRNRRGGIVGKNALNECFRNPFYMGIIRLKSMSETFLGQHKAIVSRVVFERVQDVLSGGLRRKARVKHFFVYRRIIDCAGCSRLLIAERKKGHVYYRCHTRSCDQRPIREDLVHGQFGQVLEKMTFSKDEVVLMKKAIRDMEADEPNRRASLRQELTMRSELVASRLNRLADAYMDGVFDRETYGVKKDQLLREQAEITERLVDLAENGDRSVVHLHTFLELLESAYLSFNSANDEEKREFVRMTTSNITIRDKSLVFKLNSPFLEVHERGEGGFGGPFSDTSRTLFAWLKGIVDHYNRKVKRAREEGSELEEIGLADLSAINEKQSGLLALEP
jgi:site-specific DNA recombinase